MQPISSLIPLQQVPCLKIYWLYFRTVGYWIPLWAHRPIDLNPRGSATPPPCSRYKSSQNIWWPLGLFRKASFLSKNYCGYVLDSFWINLGYFYFQHLVTLNTAYNELLLSHFGFIGQKSSSLSTSNSSFHLLWAIIYQPIRWKQNNTLREKEFDSFEFQR